MKVPHVRQVTHRSTKTFLSTSGDFSRSGSLHGTCFERRTAEGKQTEVEALLHLGLVCHLTYNPARDQTRRALMTFCGRFWAAFTNGELAEVSIPYCGTAKLSRLLLYYNVHTLLWDSRP